MLEKWTTGVNIINIKCTPFSYERCLGSFFYVHVARKKLPKWRSYEKTRAYNVDEIDTRPLVQLANLLKGEQLFFRLLWYFYDLPIIILLSLCRPINGLTLVYEKNRASVFVYKFEQSLISFSTKTNFHWEKLSYWKYFNRFLDLIGLMYVPLEILEDSSV